MRIPVLAVALFLAAVFAADAADPAQGLADIPLPAPRTEGGKPLMQALKERQSRRSFSPRKLDHQVLSDLLWAANGINRPESGQRTAPSAMNWREIEVFVVLEEGAYVYDPQTNALKAVASGDLRKVTGLQGFAATVPLNLVFVADTARMKGGSEQDIGKYAAADAACVSQNVYLFCASEGLATVLRGYLDEKALSEALQLPENKKVIFAQSVGYPAEGN